MAESNLPEPKTPLTDSQIPSIATPIIEEPTNELSKLSNCYIPQSPTDFKRKREEKEEQLTEENPKKTKHPLHKTSLCSFFRRSGTCSHGEDCRFAHNEEELQPRPDGSWDPTSKKGKEMARKAGGEESEEGDGDGNDEKSVSVMMTGVMDENGDSQFSKCVIHLSMKWNSDKFKTFLDELGVVYKEAKKKKGMSVGFITFETVEQVERATELLEGKSVGNKTLKVGDVLPRSYDDKIQSAHKRYQNAKPGASEDDENGEEMNGSGSKGKSVCDVVTPLAKLPYAEQLEQKKNSLTKILIKLTRNARKALPRGTALPEWIVNSKERGGLPCELTGIIESPLVNGYRNKCEFSVGYSVHQKPTVGFLLGNFREGVTAVEEPTNCPNVSKIASTYALVFQEFLQDSSLPIWNRFNNTGFWRQLTVREGRKSQRDGDIQNEEANISEVMLVIQVSTKAYDDDLVNNELEKLAGAFSTRAASTTPPLPLTVLAIQDHVGISNVAGADAPLRPLLIPHAQSSSETVLVSDSNEMRIHDYIGNLRFSISPTAFFQVNTLAAEKLYSLAGEWAGLDQDTLLFDVCCGTGTIGLTLANRVGMVIGIEMNASAVSDAQKNAEINGITNCKFVCAKAESVMGSLLREYLDDSREPDDLQELDDPQEQGDILHTSDTDEKRIDPLENGTASVINEMNPEISLNGMKMDTDQARDSNEEELDPKNNCLTNVGNSSNARRHFKNVVAIVDPPRGGLHPTVIKALRTHPRLRRLVYISCNPETLVANAIELCTPLSENNEKKGKIWRWKNMSDASQARHRLKSMPKSEPFQPVKAMAVDLFPHTSHCELVMLLER
ncbi:zinc finger CCCH domain-containing protein 24 isoform X2 [Amaranthus tricolor]|uniref:zinc finger CCCH domain-containing protein 24 isoform X2 n=1 Tax=Amaranthus tricolor TaxID=29722 RepID=UPI00258ADB9B|nr:zinc finger CCCH domain-containing protein 24 isoform X2 [Amaranthus tricolor]